MKALLAHLGIASGRLYLDWVSAAEGARFAELVAEFTNQVKKLGPAGCGESQEGLSREEFIRRVRVAKRVCEKAVSYTHLDVYKRQSVPSAAHAHLF